MNKRNIDPTFTFGIAAIAILLSLFFTGIIEDALETLAAISGILWIVGLLENNYHRNDTEYD